MRPKQFPIPHQQEKIALMIVKKWPMLPQEGKVKLKQAKKNIRNQSLKTSFRGREKNYRK